MKSSTIRGLARALLVGSWFLVSGRALSGQAVTEFSSEARFQLDVKVSDAALSSYLPPGWVPNVATEGNAKDCNLRVVFIDRVTINGPDGKPVGKTGSSRLVYLVAPVKDASGSAAQLVIGGLTEDPSEAPGPYGVYLPSTTHRMQRTTATDGGQILDSQDWTFAAASGERLELHIKYERGVGNKNNLTDVKFYSAKNPAYYQISREERVTDVLRNVTTSPRDRVKEFSFVATGGSYAKLFDGTQKSLSWDNITWINRTVLLP